MRVCVNMCNVHAYMYHVYVHVCVCACVCVCMCTMCMCVYACVVTSNVRVGHRDINKLVLTSM